jgi:lipopolysaccharide export system protein LptA
MARAMNVAVSGTPGPVVIALPDAWKAPLLSDRLTCRRHLFHHDEHRVILSARLDAFAGRCSMLRGTKVRLCHTVTTLILVSLAALAPLPASTLAQGLGLISPNDRRALDVEADNGIEWRQDRSVYIARDNARATRGGATLYGDTLTAHYRPVAPDRNRPPDPDSLTGSTEIYRIEADGNVRLQSETQTVYGDHGDYEMDGATAIFTGKHLKLVTPRDTVTARDSLEWYDNKLIGIARGQAVSVRDDKQLTADILIAHVEKPSDAPSRIDRIDAQDHVVVTTPTDVARGASGIYNVDTGIITLARDVTITRGDSVLAGQYGIVNLNTNISRLLNGPPGDLRPGRAPVTLDVRPGAANTPSASAPPR